MSTTTLDPKPLETSASPNPADPGSMNRPNLTGNLSTTPAKNAPMLGDAVQYTDGSTNPPTVQAALVIGVDPDGGAYLYVFPRGAPPYERTGAVEFSTKDAGSNDAAGFWTKIKHVTRRAIAVPRVGENVVIAGTTCKVVSVNHGDHTFRIEGSFVDRPWPAAAPQLTYLAAMTPVQRAAYDALTPAERAAYDAAYPAPTIADRIVQQRMYESMTVAQRATYDLVYPGWIRDAIVPMTAAEKAAYDAMTPAQRADFDAKSLARSASVARAEDTQAQADSAAGEAGARADAVKRR